MLPNLYGFDYFFSGYFSLTGDETPMASSDVVNNFDWRDRHGSDNPNSPYYNQNGYGWVTPRTVSQVAGECWAFAPVYTLESLVNIYYNQQINPNLSEQDVISCSGGGTWDGGGVPTIAINYLKNTGVVNESCFPFTPYYQSPCSNKCTQPDELIKIHNGITLSSNEDIIKESIILNGPLTATLWKWGHAMNLVGYGIVKEGDMIMDGSVSHTGQEIVVLANSPDIGKPYYVFKQSWGSWGPDNSPFIRVIIDVTQLSVFRAQALLNPLTSTNYSSSNIPCNDFDDDGYFYWGIGPKPNTCPPDAPDEPDCDDYNPFLGPYDLVYNCLLLCDNFTFSGEIIEIIGNQTWNFDSNINDKVIIKSGSTLNIENCIINMSKLSSIIIEQGGVLNIENAILTNKCGDNWQGIEVWGNSSAHQWPDTNGNYQQGRLVLNNATIENAIVAVKLWKEGDYSKSGGVVYATNSSFINNTLAVHALPYRNFHPVTFEEMPYNALFSNCTFEINADYPGYETFYKHIDLNQVNGPRFKGCDFTLSPQVENVSASSIGIGSYGSGFRVNALCTSNNVPCNDWDRSSFTGFTHGIYATGNVTSNNTFEVSMTDFTNNIYGINSLGVSNFSVLHSTFALRKNDLEDSPCFLEGGNCSSFGINMIESNGFIIEENSFTKANGAPIGYYTGIRCKDGKSEHDIIYLNTFNGLSYGNFAEGNNRSTPDDQKGLEYRCNTNTGNSRDFIVAKKDIFDDPQIRTFQGTQNKEAGNTFSAGALLPDGHFKNTGTQVINYFYNTNPPVYYTPNYVVPIRVSGVNTCLPHNGGTTSELVMTTEEKQSAEMEYFNNLTAFNNVKALFDNLKDGGNTTMLKSEVETSWPEDMWALRDNLLGKSPHLSQEVLMAVADKTEVLPESVLFEILSANPDELRKEDLINYLENKEQPLPAYMVSILRQLAGGITYKTILMQDMADYQAVKTQAANALVRSCLNDSIIDQVYLRSWLNNLDNLNADMQIVSSFMASQDYASAQTMLDLIPSTRSLEGDRLDGFNDYKTLVELQITINQQGRSIFDLDSSEQALVSAIAANPDGKGQLLARNLLTYAYGHQYNNCLPVDDTAALKSTAVLPGSTEVNNGLDITVMPNPASSWAAFAYKLPSPLQEAVLQISDAQGRHVTSFTLKAWQGQQLWDIREAKKGTYFYTLKAVNQSKSGKLVIK
ncbi:MAG: T9SS type A sorting domain-containing protein [Bacteroidales bacterium]|nr:T9SS type A sorting domain-containing protein [Bacteroidales bacterium]